MRFSSDPEINARERGMIIIMPMALVGFLLFALVFKACEAASAPPKAPDADSGEGE